MKKREHGLRGLNGCPVSNKVKQGQTRSNKVKQGKTRSNKAKQGQARQNKVKQGQTRSKQGQAPDIRFILFIRVLFYLPPLPHSLPQRSLDGSIRIHESVTDAIIRAGTGITAFFGGTGGGLGGFDENLFGALDFSDE